MPPGLTSVPKENQKLKRWLNSDKEKPLQLRLLALIFSFFPGRSQQWFLSQEVTHAVLDESDHWELGP